MVRRVVRGKAGDHAASVGGHMMTAHTGRTQEIGKRTLVEDAAARPPRVAPAVQLTPDHQVGAIGANRSEAPPKAGIDKPGFIDNTDGANLRSGPAEAGGRRCEINRCHRQRACS